MENIQDLNKLRKDATKIGIKKCAIWLTYCLEVGWKKEHLDDLEKLYWRWKDKNGNLK